MSESKVKYKVTVHKAKDKKDSKTFDSKEEARAFADQKRDNKNVERVSIVETL